MAKTTFSNGTIVTPEFLNSMYQAGGGHVHDGGTEDGHAPKIDLASGVTGTLPKANLPKVDLEADVEGVLPKTNMPKIDLTTDVTGVLPVANLPADVAKMSYRAAIDDNWTLSISLLTLVYPGVADYRPQLAMLTTTTIPYNLNLNGAIQDGRLSLVRHYISPPSNPSHIPRAAGETILFPVYVSNNTLQTVFPRNGIITFSPTVMALEVLSPEGLPTTGIIHPISLIYAVADSAS